MVDTIINLIQGDHGFNIDFDLKDADGNALNISGSTVLFKVGRPGATASTVLFTGTCVIDDGATGACHYTPTSSDLSSAGMYRGEIEVDYGNKVVTDRTFQVIVRGDLG